MDKDWVHNPNRVSSEYISGARKFADNAQANAGNPDKILCPCKVCCNGCHQHFDTVYGHLVMNGMDPTYDVWVFHGERLTTYVEDKSDDDVQLPDTYRMFRDVYFDDESSNVTEVSYERREAMFINSVQSAVGPLYPGCTKYTLISALVALNKHKAAHNLSDTGFDELLKLICDMLPIDNTLPQSIYESKKLMKTFDLGYEKIHACINDCCLFRKEYEHMDTCPKCGASRWKFNERSKKIRKGVPAKVLRYFPVIPRLRRMFRSPENAEQLLWHVANKSRDSKMRHPVDSLAWDTINRKWPNFASDPRNLRLGFSSDGFNPFGDLSSRYSCWPVILVVYNLAPWLCMSKDKMMLTLLIPGPKQPGNDIDVFLEPLIEDLKELWVNGVEIYDALSKSRFNLKAVLMWTINDFPAYGNLSGYSTKGEAACPVCGVLTCSQWLNSSKKYAYMGHRRFILLNHPFRDKKSWFDGQKERRGKPRILSGSDILSSVKNFENNWGKSGRKRKKSERTSCWPWKKKSIFFQLPYWEFLLVRHNLDVMHIEKNVCESLIGTLLNVKGKSKDGLSSRMDLEQMRIRNDLHPKMSGQKYYLPAAPHTLSRTEKLLFCKRLQNLKLPDGYGSNIGRRVLLPECKIVGLKSHDCHVLMQQLLPVALRGILPKGPRNAIFRLCGYFNEVYQKVIDKRSLESCENHIAETLCMLERFFPPSFFDIMVHLTIHIAREARLCGPAQFRHMYPFERYMKVLKGYVKNRANPEGCIAERYMAEECVRFCGDYLKQTVEISVRCNRNEEIETESLLEGRPISKGIVKTMTNDMLEVAHRYVLFNHLEVEPYIEMHLDDLKSSDRRLARNEGALQKKHMETFSMWLANKVNANANGPSTTLKWLVNGPRKDIVSHSGYIINGRRFHTKDVERTTQNSGVSLEADTICRSSARDTAQVMEKISYYGVIKDIILLNYYSFEVPLFHCDWANINNGVKYEDGFVLVNLHEGQSQFQRDPFILASQAKQVFYCRDTETSTWYVVLHAPPRGYDEHDNPEDNTYTPPMPLDVSRLDNNVEEEGEGYVRVDCEGMTV